MTSTLAPGQPTGRYDHAKAACQFSCGAKGDIDVAKIVEQPAPASGALTRCPVSGAVFPVEEGRPRVTIAGHDYVTCCSACATRLQEEPGRFLYLAAANQGT